VPNRRHAGTRADTSAIPLLELSRAADKIGPAQTRFALVSARVTPGDMSRKLAVMRAAASHRFPTADIDQMLDEIERGYSAT